MAAFPKSVLTEDAGPPPCRTVDVYDNAPAPEQAHRIIRQARQQSPIAMGSLSYASRRSPGNYPNAQCGRASGKASIERGHLRGRLNPGRVEHAAVRQFESCPDPQLGQFPGGVGGESEGLDLQFSQCISRVITAAGSNGSDKYSARVTALDANSSSQLSRRIPVARAWWLSLLSRCAMRILASRMITRASPGGLPPDIRTRRPR